MNLKIFKDKSKSEKKTPEISEEALKIKNEIEKNSSNFKDVLMHEKPLVTNASSEKAINKRKKFENNIENKIESQKNNYSNKSNLKSAIAISRLSKLRKKKSSYRSVFEKHSDKEKESFFKTILLILRTRFVPSLLVAAIAFSTSCAIFFWKSFNSISMEMSLNYEESIKGLYPNGSRFNMYNVHSEEVMALAIKYAGIEGCITPKELSKYVSISPIITRNSDTDYFIATSYNISFNKPSCIKGISTGDMMNMINKAYTDYFIKNYAYNISFINTEVENTDSTEYKELASQISTKINQLKKLVNQRTEESPSFKSKITGFSFKDLNQILNNLKEQQYTVFNSFVTEKGVAKSNIETIDSYQYRNKTLGVKRSRNQDEYAIRNEAVKMYNRAIIESVLVPTVDSKEQFYMSRTKIGIDDITADAYAFLNDATNYQVAMDLNSDYINNIIKNSADNDYVIADFYAQTVINELERVEELIVSTDDDYIAGKTKSYVTFKQSGVSYLYRANYKTSAVIAAFMFILMLFAYYEEHKKSVDWGEEK